MLVVLRRRLLIVPIAIVLGVGLGAVAAPAVAAGTGTVTGHVTVPETGGFYGTIGFYRQDGDGDGVPDETVSTSDGGNYSAVLPVGTYKVGFSVPTDDDFAAQYYNEAADLADAQTIKVTDGGTTSGIDASLGYDTTKGTVSGLISVTGGGTYTGDVDFFDAATGTAEGSAFAYQGTYQKLLPPGSYKLGFGLDPDDAYSDTYYPSAATLAAGQAVVLNANATTTANGTVTVDPNQGQIGGTVTTPSGNFSGNATFTWQGADPADHPVLGTYVYQGSYDRYLRPGTYLVGFSLGDSDGYLDQYYDDKPTPAGATLVTVGVGQDVTGIDGALEADLGVGHVQGSVTTAAGPYSGTVSFFRQDDDGDAIADYTTAVDGTYDRALPPGHYKVGFDVAGGDGYTPAYYGGSSLATATPIDIEAGGTVTGIDGTLVLTPTAPAIPAPPTAVADNGAAEVHWVAPAANGSPISGYTVTSSPGGLTLQTAGTSGTLTGLTNGTSYTFTLVATNGVGSSSPSAPSNAVTPAGPPLAPTKVRAVRGDQQATVSWTAPSGNGSPLTGYTVTSSPGGAVQQLGASATSTTVTGLTNGSAYTFSVVAKNAIGSSAAASSAAVTPAGVPSAPTKVIAVRGNTKVTVSWHAPSGNGSAITGYVVQSGSLKEKVAASARSAVIPGLTNGTSYRFTVVAVNVVGSSPASARSAAVVPAGRPGRIAKPTTSVHKGTVTLTWKAPTSDGSAIEHYVVTCSNHTHKTVTGRSASFTKLPKGTYTFTVVAVNVVGSSTASSAATVHVS